MKIKKVNASSSQKILDTAFECLSTKGYANVSMRDIANEAGVALSQLNYYFKNKEGLFVEVIGTMKNQYLSEIEEKLSTSKNIETKIDSLLEYFKELNFKNPQLLKLCIDFTAQALWVPVFASLLKDLYEKIVVIIEKNIFFEGADENPEFSCPKVLARFIFGALFGISVQVQLGLDEKYSDQSLDIVMKLPFLMK